jgi:predicted alpha/beta superfamily hydrolase
MNFNQSKTPMRTTAISVTLFGLLTAGTASSGIAQQTRVDTAPSITLPNTHVHVLHSRVNGRTYVIQVALPSLSDLQKALGETDSVNHQRGVPPRYPTLYLLDMGMFPFLYGYAQYGGTIGNPSRAILVGVLAVEPSERKWYDRLFDYTPPLTAADSEYLRGKSPPMGLSGGAPQFLRVLKEEIIPLIDSSYPTSGDRGIMGVSMGGLFVAYALLEDPELFTRYAMISPSLWYPVPARERGLILALEPEFAKQHPTFHKTVYINVGSEENSGMIAVAWQLARQLCSSMSKGYYKGMDLGAETIADAPHGSPRALMRGLVALYAGDSTRVKPGRGVMQDCR